VRLREAVIAQLDLVSQVVGKDKAFVRVVIVEGGEKIFHEVFARQKASLVFKV
jgi:hypothetical protein